MKSTPCQCEHDSAKQWNYPLGLIAPLARNSINQLPPKLAMNEHDYNRIITETAVFGDLSKYLILTSANVELSNLELGHPGKYAFIWRSTRDPHLYKGFYGQVTHLKPIENNSGLWVAIRGGGDVFVDLDLALIYHITE